MGEISIQKTGRPDVIVASDGRLTLTGPIQIKLRSGRKLVNLLEGLARAFYWQQLLDNRQPVVT